MAYFRTLKVNDVEAALGNKLVNHWSVIQKYVIKLVKNIKLNTTRILRMFVCIEYNLIHSFGNSNLFQKEGPMGDWFY